MCVVSFDELLNYVSDKIAGKIRLHLTNLLRPTEVVSLLVSLVGRTAE